MPSVNDILDTLGDRVAFVHAIWKLYKSWYGSKENLEMMRQISPQGFSVIRQGMFNEVVRFICSITDPAGSGNKKNVSLRRVIEDARDSLGEDELNALGELLSEIDREAISLRTYRNKMLSHFDYETALASCEYKISHDEVDNVLGKIAKFMETIELSVRNQGTIYSWSSAGNAYGELSWLLRDSLRLKKLRTLSKNSSITDAQIRKLCTWRSDRRDQEVLVDAESAC